MATSYTTYFNLGKPANGDLNWGPVINGNTDVIDVALQAAKNASNLTAGTLPAARLPVADANNLGGVKGFSNLTISNLGALSLTSANVVAALGFTPVDDADLGAANGVATLDANGKVPTAQLDISSDDITEGSALFFTTQRAADAAPVQSVAGKTGTVTLTTDDISEGINSFYYTPAKFDTRLAAKTTDNLTEGSTNVYWTSARFNSAFSGKSTSDLTEGSNLYFTTGRVNNQISAYSRAFKDIADGSGSVQLSAASYNDVLRIAAGAGIDVAFDSVNKKITLTNTGVTSVNGQTGAVTVSGGSGDVSVRSFAQLNVIGGLDAHADAGQVSDFYMNTEGAKTLRKIIVSCPNTPASGSIVVDLKLITSQGGAATSLFPSKTKPTITCANGAAWAILSGASLDTTAIPDNAMITVTIVSSEAGATDLRVELFE